MKKFLVLYKAPVESFEQMMKNTTPEQQKAGMKAWQTWIDKAGSALIDAGAPLGKGTKVTNSGGNAQRNELGGYSIMKAESSEKLAASLKGHPHFEMPQGWIEVTEIMPMPEM